MKKITALLLAILMIGGMLPTVFAADAVMNPVYVFSNTTFGGSGNVQYHMHSGTGTFNSSISSGYYEYVHNVGLGAFPLLEAVHVWTAQEEAFGNCALILKADVDVCGTYDVAIDYVRSGYAGRIGIYFVPVSWLDANYAVKSITTADVKPIINNENAICLVKDYDTHSSAGTESRYNVNDVKFSENEYYIFITTDKSDYPSTSNGRYYASIKNIALTGKAYATATISDATLRVGDVAAIAVTAQSADGSSTELSDVTYASSNPDVATVATDGKVTAIGEGSTVITATGTAGDVSVSASVKVEVSFDYIYSFAMEAVPGATAAVAASTLTSFEKLDPEVSTGAWHYVTNKNYSTFSLYSGGTQSYALEPNIGDNYVVLKGKVDEPGVYETSINFSRATYGGRFNVYVVPQTYADNKWTMTSNALSVGDIISDEGVTKVFSVDCHSDGTDASPAEGATLNLTERNFYFIFTVEQGATKITSESYDGIRYYGLPNFFKFDCKGTLTAELSNNVTKPGETANISLSAKNSNGKSTAPENVSYKSSDDSVASVSADGKVEIKSVGTATITVTATVGEESVSTVVHVGRNAVWDPNYVLTHKAVQSATAAIQNGLALNKVTELKEDISTGHWSYVNQVNINGAGLYADEYVFQVKKANFGKNAIVVALDVDKAGTYVPTVTYNKKPHIGKVNVYLLPESYVAEKGWKMTSDALPVETIEAEAAEWRVASVNGYSATNVLNLTLDGNVLNLDEKTYLMFVVHNNDENIINDPETSGSRLWGEICGVSLTRTGSVTLLAGKTELTKGDTTELRSVVKDNRDNTATAEVTFESLNTAVATVSGSTVTAVAPGTATIKATATIDGVVVSDTVEITVGEETAEKEVSFAAYSSIKGEKIKVNGTEYDEFVDEILRGTEMTISAPEVDGYTFRYWVRGSADNGKWISNDTTYSFSLMTNTMLTAVYDENVETEDKKVEFWNQNGTYLDTVAVANGEIIAPTATLTGFTFRNWYVNDGNILDVSKLTEAVTRAVAQYDANAISGDVKFDGVSESEVVYNKKIDKSVSGAKVWKRDGKIVGYGESYTYYVWGATEITYSTEAVAEKAPIVVLESGNDAWMIEYDAGDKQIVEAGIIFGESTAITVDACSAKATSQKNLSHGQFTATSDYSKARGYIIYEDNGNYIVKYSD